MISLALLIAAVVLSLVDVFNAPARWGLEWFKLAFACFLLSLLFGRYML